jgi:Outer membrane receptor proteins, mostly Fe transport
MYSRLSSLFAMLVLLCHTALAQTETKLSGRIVDAQKKPVPYATVALLRADSSVVNGDLTTEEGNFTISPAAIGKFMLKLSGIGFETKVVSGIELSAEKPQKNLGSISVVTTTQQMKEVQVVGEKPLMEMSVDKKVFNVEKNITTAGGSAADVLQNVPSVSVDVDGGVSLRGKSNVTILIDGKPATLLAGDVATALQSMPASAISNVEVITNPSAKYDAQGVTGIINIITRKDRKMGINGMITAGAGTRDKYNAGINFNMRNDKWNLFANSNVRFNRNYMYFTTTRENLFNTNSYHTFEDYMRRNNGWFTSIGAEYTIDDKNSIILTENLNSSLWGNNSEITYREFSSPDVLQYKEIRKSENEGKPFSTSTSLDYKHKFAKPKQELTANVTYAQMWVNRIQNYYTYGYDSNEVIKNKMPIIQRSPGGGGNNSVNAQADFTTPFAKSARLDAGWKSQLFWFNSENHPVIDTGNGEEYFALLKNAYDYTQNTHAVYTSVANEYKQWSYMAGLRLEYATYDGTDISLKGNTYHNEFLNLFPSAFVSYKLKKDQAVYINYTRRINRPGFFQLMPYIDFSNPQDTNKGNPSLIPEFITNMELNYSKQYKKGHSLMAGAYYQRTKNMIERYRFIYPDGRMFTQPRNLNSGTTYGMDMTGRAQILPVWDVMLNTNLFYNEIEGSNIDSTANNSGFSWFAKLNTNVKLSKTLSLQVNANYEAPRAFPQYTQQEVYWVDVALRKTFWKGNGTVVLNVSDIFNGRKYYMIYDFDLYNQTMLRDRETRIGNITFTYRFGKSETRSRRSGNGQNGARERNNLRNDDNGGSGGF